MTFIEVVPEARATGAVAEMYEVDREAFAGLPNLTKAFSLHPEVYAAWRQLNGAIKANMDLRRYELATVAAARRLRSATARSPTALSSCPTFSSRRCCEPWWMITGRPTSSLRILP